MKRIEHPKFAAVRCAGAAAACLAVFSLGGCVAESPTEELGTVNYSPGFPQAPVAQPPAQIGMDQAGLSGQPSIEPPGDNPMDTPANDVGGPGQVPEPGPSLPDPAQDNMEMDPVAEPPEMDPADPSEPMAGSNAPPVVNEPPEEPEMDVPVEPTGPGMLTVAFTSKAAGGRYAPRNVGAVWIEDAQGGFVKTIERWAAIRAADLRNWNGASGGWGFSFFGVSTGGSADQMDVITAATLRSHGMHMATWNMKNVDGEVVPDGKYAVVVEVADGSARVDRIEFEKGPMPQMVQGDGSVFSNMTVTYSH